MRNVKLLGLLLSALLLSACTGEKQNTRTLMQEREIFLISGSYPKDVCLSQKFKDTLQQEFGLTNIILNASENSVNCAYFSRTSTSCVKFSFTEEYPKACVIAADRDATTKHGQINGKAIADLMIGLLNK
ncbi:MAG: Unknown protein [uncultured Sulfurovum sp.]|uniref:Lipoprotein n=1 Tax=uncultured Sulfurovum sp. TaxID=269237 RepID=A0A6S6UIM5_9BACT|nr:MAG: Unknown protein [uncultured Sulfurovum sp.]